MTEPTRNALQSAVAFAKLFVDAAEEELSIHPLTNARIVVRRQDSVDALYSALENVETSEEGSCTAS